MTITSQQVDAWDDEVDAAYEAGRQEGMKQERALWELSKLGQEIEAQPEHYDQTALELCDKCGWRTLIPEEACLNCERKAQPEQEPDENALRLQFSRIRYSIGNPINLRRHDNGKFIADVEEEYQAWKQAQPEHQPNCASLTTMLTSMPPKPASCDCKLKPPPVQPQRQWVGLTDEEINAAAACQSWKPFAQAIEAKLKEKNTC